MQVRQGKTLIFANKMVTSLCSPFIQGEVPGYDDEWSNASRYILCTATKVAAHVSNPDASYKVDLALWL